MAAVRANAVTNQPALQKFCTGVNRLKHEFPGTTTADVNIPGTPRKVSTYDLFVVWHNLAMNTFTRRRRRIATRRIADRYFWQA